MAVRTGLIAAEELARFPEEEARVELVRGELVRIAPAGFEHGTIAFAIATLLHAYARQHKLRIVCAAETGFILAHNPDTVRAPDAAFVATERSAVPVGGLLQRANRYGQRYGTPPGRRRNSSPSRPSRTSPPPIGRSSRA